MQLFDRLHLLKSVASNAYLYEDEDGWVLVDTSMWGLSNPFPYLSKLGHEPSALKHIVVTHADIDHIGNLQKVQAKSGARVYAGAKSAELIPKGKFPQHDKVMIDSISTWIFRVKPTSAEHITIVRDGETLPLLGGLQVIEAPGHTNDHMAYFSPSTGILFAGDAVFSLNKKLTPSPESISRDHDQAKQTAVKLANLSPTIFCCGHGDPFQHEMKDVMGLLHSMR